MLRSRPVTQQLDDDTFMVWASDRMVYGPLTLDTLVQWAKEFKLRRGSWRNGKSIGAKREKLKRYVQLLLRAQAMHRPFKQRSLGTRSSPLS